MRELSTHKGGERMIIDMILDRKGFEEDGVMDYYNPKRFYDMMMAYGEDGGSGFAIARAMDCGTEDDVRRELCGYIDRNQYNPEIKDYINSVEWIKGGN